MNISPKFSGRILIGFHTYGQSYMHVPALLRHTGLPLDAVFTTRHPLRNVRWIDRRYFFEPSHWAGGIEERLSTGEYGFFVNVDEPGLTALFRHQWDAPSARFLPFPPDSEFARTVDSKIEFHEWCERKELPTPESHPCPSFDEAMALAARLPGPWLLKGDSGSGGQSVVRPGQSKIGSVADKSRRWLVQRDEGNHVSSGLFFAVRGRVLAWFAFRKVVCLNRGFGPVVLGRSEIRADTEELCRRVAAASDITGLTGFDFVRSDERGPLLIDSHLGRMPPTLHFDRLFGVNIASCLGAHIAGMEAPAAPPTPGPDFIKFPEVLQLAIEGGLPALLRNLKGACNMPLAPAGDAGMAANNAIQTVLAQTRVNLGRMRRQIFNLDAQ